MENMLHSIAVSTKARINFPEASQQCNYYVAVLAHHVHLANRHCTLSLIFIAELTL